MRRKQDPQEDARSVQDILRSVSVVAAKKRRRAKSLSRPWRRDRATMEMTARDVQREIINAHAAALLSSADPAELHAIAAALWIKEIVAEAAGELRREEELPKEYELEWLEYRIQQKQGGAQLKRRCNIL